MRELPGTALSDLPDYGISHARAVGQAVAAFHRRVPSSLSVRLPELDAIVARVDAWLARNQ